MLRRPDDQQLFLERTDPDYLKSNLMPGRTSSFDCLMQNLEGKYIWVKLIFSRAETNNSEEDFRYVFMMQDIPSVSHIMTVFRSFLKFFKSFSVIVGCDRRIGSDDVSYKQILYCALKGCK